MSTIFWLSLCIFINIAKSNCIGHNNANVDWWLMWRRRASRNYMYKQSTGAAHAISPPGAFTENPNDIRRQNHAATRSPLQNTLRQLYRHQAFINSEYYIYSDQPPTPGQNDAWGANPGDAYGHLKGILDVTHNFWIIHSQPRYPARINHRYPWHEAAGEAGISLDKGQVFFCITSHTPAQMTQFIIQLDKMHPYIYQGGRIVGGAFHPFVFGTPLHPFVFGAPRFQEYHFNHHGTDFIHIAKNGHSYGNIFKHIPHVVIGGIQLNYGFIWQTYRHGESCCAQTYGPIPNQVIYPYDILDVQRIHWPGGNFVSWASGSDHSKIGISYVPPANTADKWICVGDLNRAGSQNKRGGGFMCLRNSALWHALSPILEMHPGYIHCENLHR
eukprot:283598_1